MSRVGLARAANHLRAPLSAAFVVALREAFGPDQVIVTCVREGPVRYGTPWAEQSNAAPPADREHA